MEKRKGDNVVAIDGPAASGKSTVARLVARRLDAIYVNTGNMYRAVTLAALRRFGETAPFEPAALESMLSGIALEYAGDAEGEPRLLLDGEDVEKEIRSPKVSSKVSAVAAVPAVREWLVEKQRSFAKRGMIVMEGRDIGTVVFPNAKHKFFLTASPEVRARRRLAQDGECPDGATVASVAEEIAARDKMDMERAVSPLKRAEDATLIDSGDLSAEQVAEKIVAKIKETE
jgi:cytidylate kinase